MSDSLNNRLWELADSDLYSFHMPGHKRLITDKLMDWYSMDITEISGFDNLHFPNGILLKAQKKAAEIYQSEETFYLVGGSTAGILSAISAINDRKKLLISRNSHFSVYHAAYLNDLTLVYIYPQYDEITGLSIGTTALEVAEKLKNEPGIGAVIITSPTYEGVTSDIAGIAKIVHEQNACLIVDQAHGAHFGFHPDFPENAVKQGADIVIHSLHKTLPALTQTALLHVNGTRIDRHRLKRFLRIYQSSSPSYPLMAGIERCLEIVETNGDALFTKMLKMRRELTDRVSQMKHFQIPNHINDPCKMIIMTKGITGRKLSEMLRENYLLEMEMATDKYIIAIITMMDEAEGFRRLTDALYEIDNHLLPANEKVERKTLSTPERSSGFESPSANSGYGNKNNKLLSYYAPEIMMSLKKAYDSEVIELPISETDGHIAAEFAFRYPPGIPLIIPGEKIDYHVIKMLKEQGDTFWILR